VGHKNLKTQSNGCHESNRLDASSPLVLCNIIALYLRYPLNGLKLFDLHICTLPLDFPLVSSLRFSSEIPSTSDAPRSRFDGCNNRRVRSSNARAGRLELNAIFDAIQTARSISPRASSSFSIRSCGSGESARSDLHFAEIGANALNTLPFNFQSVSFRPPSKAPPCFFDGCKNWRVNSSNAQTRGLELSTVVDSIQTARVFSKSL